MTMRVDLCSTRCTTKRLCRLASTISRELKRTSVPGPYDSNLTHSQCHARRRLPKLHAHGILIQVVRHQLKLLWSPQQIARKLKFLWPNNPEKSVSLETIYNAIYMHPPSELNHELIACLRQHNQVRKARSCSTDRRYQMQDMQSIHICPPEAEARLIPGYRSSVGTLVERTTGFVVLAKMNNPTTKAVVDSFTAVLNREPSDAQNHDLRPMLGDALPQNPYRATWRPDLLFSTHTAHGSAAQMKTPMGCCASTCRNDWTC